MSREEYNEEVTNEVILSGYCRKVETVEYFHEGYYRMIVEVQRLSGASDLLPVIFHEKLILPEEVINQFIKIRGQFQSFTRKEDGKSRHFLYVFSFHVEKAMEEEYQNEVKLTAYLCKPPIYRKTPQGRQIADLLVAVHRTRKVSDYIPCICWGKNALTASEQLEIGAKVQIIGRIQSRTYHNGEKTAYELSVIEFYKYAE